MAQEQKKRRTILFLLLTLGLSAGALVAVSATLGGDLGQIGSSLGRLNPLVFLAAVVLHLSAFGFLGYRLHLLAGMAGGSIGWRAAGGIIYANLLFGYTTPSHAGGDAVRIYLMKRRGLGVGDAGVVVLEERILDAVVLFSILPLGMALFWNVIASDPLLLAIFWASILVTVGSIAVFFGLLRGDWMERVIRLFIRKRAGRVAEEVAQFRRGLQEFFSRRKFQEHRWAYLGSALATLGFYLVEFTIPSLVLLSLGLEPHWFLSFAAQTILILFVSIPITPGGSGTSELIGFAMYRQMNVPGAHLVAFVALWRLIVLYVSLAASGAVNALVLREKKSADDADEHR